MDIIKRLERNIEHQTRNGRYEIYVSTDDLEQLGMTSFERKGMVYIELNKLERLINLYKEKQNSPEEILKRRTEESWEK